MTPSESNSMVHELPELALRARASKAYTQESRQAVEEQWILKYLPLVRHVVNRVVGHISGLRDIDDLISAGTLGLVKAARAFDPAQEAEFKTYAYIRIKGAVLDELRERSFVPSGAMAQIRRVREAYRTHLAETGVAPDDELLAGRLGISIAQLYRSMEEARKQHFLSIHGIGDESPALGESLFQDRQLRPDQQAERAEQAQRLAEAMRSLPERDRLVLLLYYERELTMKESAKVLGVTESRVSQLHASALFKLSMKLGGAT